MALTKKQVYDLNNMNVAAQNAKLGDILKGGSGGAQSDWNQNDETQPDYIKNRIGGYYTEEEGYIIPDETAVLAYGYIEGGYSDDGFLETEYARRTIPFPLEEGVTYKVLVWKGVSPPSFDWRQAAENKIPGEYFECTAEKIEIGGRPAAFIGSSPFSDLASGKVTNGWGASYMAGDDTHNEGAQSAGVGEYAQCYLAICSSVKKTTTPVLQQIPAEYTTIKGGYDSYDILLDVVFRPDEFTYDETLGQYIAKTFQDLPLTSGQTYKVVVNDKEYNLIAEGGK